MHIASVSKAETSGNRAKKLFNENKQFLFLLNRPLHLSEIETVSSTKKKLVNAKFLVNNSLCFSLDQEFDYDKQSRLSSWAQFCGKENFF